MPTDAGSKRGAAPAVSLRVAAAADSPLTAYLLGLAVRNALRHKLRTALTIAGIVVAIVAFGLLRTIIDAWYAGADASWSARLMTRNAISLTFSRYEVRGAGASRA